MLLKKKSYLKLTIYSFKVNLSNAQVRWRTSEEPEFWILGRYSRLAYNSLRVALSPITDKNRTINTIHVTSVKLIFNFSKAKIKYTALPIILFPCFHTCVVKKIQNQRAVIHYTASFFRKMMFS